MLKEDFDTLVPAAGGVKRRTFVQGALGSGFAASVLPVMAQTAVKTPSDGLTAGEVMIDVNGFKMPAYRAAPAGKTGLPVYTISLKLNDLERRGQTELKGFEGTTPKFVRLAA